jgi:hypothetical protein
VYALARFLPALLTLLLFAAFSVCSCFCRSMSDASSSTRHSTRASRPPISLAEEQAAFVLSQLEQRDLVAALRSSLASSWESDEDDEEAVAEAEEEAEEEKEEEEKEEAAPDEQKEGWSTELHDIDIPLPRLRHLVNRPPPADTTAFQLLQRFLPQQLMEEFAQHTNSAAPQDWRPTTAAELYAFLGVHIYMGIDRLPSTELYWSQTFGHPFITTLFSRDRFKQLLRFFSVVAPDPAAAERDPLPFVRPLAEKLNQSFAAHFTPTQHLALDEAMAAFKGRSPIKQYSPTKPHKWGYKIICLASEDYLLRFEVYEGKEVGRSEHGATHDTVIRMTHDYAAQQLTLFTDSFFTSPTLLHSLQQRGIHLCGSVRRNRKGLPDIPQNEVKDLSQGQWIQRQKGDMSLAVWKDQRVMWILYNHCSPREVAALDRWSEAGNKISIGCPKAIHDYFYHARSVDIINQLHYNYLIGRKARRCWPRLAWWLLDMCIINAFKLWSMGQQQVSQLRFREELMHELVKQLPSEDTPRKRGAGLHPAHALASEHFTIHAATERDCKVCSHQPQDRKLTRFVCAACGVHLCTGNCFSVYHSKQ